MDAFLRKIRGLAKDKLSTEIQTLSLNLTYLKSIRIKDVVTDMVAGLPFSLTAPDGNVHSAHPLF